MSLKLNSGIDLNDGNMNYNNKIDPILNRVKTAEEENIILQAREEARQQIKREFESRLKKLESIHPNDQHQYS